MIVTIINENNKRKRFINVKKIIQLPYNHLIKNVCVLEYVNNDNTLFCVLKNIKELKVEV